jgi:flavin-binding protein dodecin
LYKIIELVGSSDKSFEDAIKTAIETASKTLRDLRVAEVEKLDVRIENNKIAAYRAKIKLSFKFDKG